MTVSPIRCERCKFYVPTRRSNEGLCHRNAPTVNTRVTDQAYGLLMQIAWERYGEEAERVLGPFYHWEGIEITLAVWPSVDGEEDWCGEFAEK